MTDATQGPGMAGGDTAPLLARARAALEGTTPGPWLPHNMVHEGRQMTPDELGEYVCNSAKLGSPDRFFFVAGKHDDGSDADVCLTGNGPRGFANTRLIASAPSVIADMADALAAALARVEALEGALTEIAAFDDVGACEYHDRTGGYAAFDEPGAVEAARAALKGGAA